VIGSATVQWARVAAPQEDAYDSRVALHFSPAWAPLAARRSKAPHLFEGRVEVCHATGLFGSEREDAPPSHPNIRAAEELIRLWPAAFTQCRTLLTSVAVFVHPRIPMSAVSPSISASGPQGLGAVTINSATGLAQASFAKWLTTN
jgi:hypothetical protein